MTLPLAFSLIFAFMAGAAFGVWATVPKEPRLRLLDRDRPYSIREAV